MEASARSAYRCPAIAFYSALWLVAFIVLRRNQTFELEEAVAALVILGLILPPLSLLVTRRSIALRDEVRHPVRETVLLLGYLVIFALVVVFGFDRIARITAEPLHSIVLLSVKLTVAVIVPATLLIAASGYRIRDLAPFSLRARDLSPALWMSVAVLGMQCLIGRGLHDMRAAALPPAALILGVPLSFAWLIVEVGVVEEFLFRVLLQNRLAALLRSEWAGLAISAVLFGLVHAPGLYLRTAATMEGLAPHPTVASAICYSIVITSLAGLFLGILWMRTKNFAILVIVHAAGDLLPNLVPFLRSFHLAG